MTLYEDQISSLNQDLTRALNKPSPQLTGLSPFSRSAKYPDPPLFDKTRINLNAFIFKLKSKLSVNLDQYLINEMQINYAYGRLEKKAEQQILSRINQDNIAAIKNMDDFLKALQTYFGDLDKKQTAQQAIYKLKQANKPFSEYLTLFQSHIKDTEFNETN